nr:hypothetical protein [uncultured Treponema sp.]
MRKINYIFLTIISATLMVFTACGSTKQEASGKNTTFVVTKPDTDGKVYSIMVFKELTEIKATYMRTNDQFDIPVSSCTYDSETTSIIVNKPKNIPYAVKDMAFTITGVPAFPAEFILHGGVYVRTNPGVFINGKLAVLGTDYTFDKKTHHLKFITPVDSDKDSYEIMWLTKNGTSAMSNNIGPYAAQYKKLESAWYKGIK